ncbi:MAG: VTT domain-containing protein [Dokdonella sp.]
MLQVGDGLEPAADSAAATQPSRLRPVALGVAALFVLGALAILWLVTPLREWADVAHLVAAMGQFGASPWAPLLMLAAYLIGGLVFFPVNVLIAVTVILFGSLLGGLYALIGSLASAALLYEIGRAIRNGPLQTRLSPRLQRLGARLARRGLPAIVFVRIVPIAPYSLVNLVAGAARIGRRDYLLGSALGMLPGIVVSALFVDRVVAWIAHPGPLTFSLLALALLAAFTLTYLLRRRIARIMRGR